MLETRHSAIADTQDRVSNLVNECADLLQQAGDRIAALIEERATIARNTMERSVDDLTLAFDSREGIVRDLLMSQADELRDKFLEASKEALAGVSDSAREYEPAVCDRRGRSGGSNRRSMATVSTRP